MKKYALLKILFISVLLLTGCSKSGNSDYKDSNANQSQENLSNPSIELTGKVKLVKKFENYSDIDKCGNFFVLESSANKTVVNSVGQILADVSNEHEVKYCNDDGTILVGETSNAYSIYRNNKKIYDFLSYADGHDSFMYYDNGVIYYDAKNAGNSDYVDVVAYDLNSEKELWRTQKGWNPIVLDEVVLLSDDSIIVSKSSGEIIDQSNDEYDVHGSYSSYYARVYHINSTKLINRIEIYDYSKNLISNIVFDDKCWFNYMMSNGFYSVTYSDEDIIRVYDFNSNLIKDNLNYYDYYKGRAEIDGNTIVTKINLLDNEKVSVLEASSMYRAPHLILYQDGNILEVHSSDSSSNNTGVNYLSYQRLSEPRTFVFGYKEVGGDKWQNRGLLINFQTGLSKEIDDVYSDGLELVGGKYFAIKKNSEQSTYTYKFYDSNLNKLTFELPTNGGTMYSITDEWLLLNKKMYNIVTGDSYDIDIVDGRRVITKYAIIVKSENVYYLYQFI